MNNHHTSPKGLDGDAFMERSRAADSRADDLIARLAEHGFAACKSWPGADGAPRLILDLSEVDKLLGKLGAALGGS